jgi:RHS repeat-associated protein
VTQAYLEVTYRDPTDGTTYIGGVYEKHADASVTKYYGFGGRNVAMRQVGSGGGAGTLYYLLADHLGGTTEVLNSSGTSLSDLKYWPYGDVRAGGITETDKLFTGQQVEPDDSALGLYNYRARFNSTTTGRFMSADTITPGVMDPQGLNRYTYVRGNPVRFTDPSGHCWSPGFPRCIGTDTGCDLRCQVARGTNAPSSPKEGSRSDDESESRRANVQAAPSAITAALLLGRLECELREAIGPLPRNVITMRAVVTCPVRTFLIRIVMDFFEADPRFLFDDNTVPFGRRVNGRGKYCLLTDICDLRLTFVNVPRGYYFDVISVSCLGFPRNPCRPTWPFSRASFVSKVRYVD